MKALTGRESSLLALLAQSESMSDTDKGRILSKLDGQARCIAEVIAGRVEHPEEGVRGIADGFLQWAKALPRVRALQKAGKLGRHAA